MTEFLNLNFMTKQNHTCDRVIHVTFYRVGFNGLNAPQIKFTSSATPTLHRLAKVLFFYSSSSSLQNFLLDFTKSITFFQSNTNDNCELTF